MSEGPFADWLRVLTLAQQAHEAVRQADWDTFLQLEDQYFSALAATQARPVNIASLDADRHGAFTQLVQQVIDLHHETTLLAEVYRNKLADELALTSNQGRLLKLYQ